MRIWLKVFIRILDFHQFSHKCNCKILILNLQNHLSLKIGYYYWIDLTIPRNINPILMLCKLKADIKVWYHGIFTPIKVFCI